MGALPGGEGAGGLFVKVLMLSTYNTVLSFFVLMFLGRFRGGLGFARDIDMADPTGRSRVRL
jgi:hypothetical protein